MNARPPLPPFTENTALQKVRAAQDAWNTRDPERVSLAYTEDTEWRNRAEFLNDRVALFMRDYPRRAWLKMLGHARVLDARENEEWIDKLAPEELRENVERLFLIRIVSYDWNWPNYITQRFTAAEVEKLVAPLKARIAELEAQLAKRSSL